jgi:DNA-binding PadR family transcriptional regulator
LFPVLKYVLLGLLHQQPRHGYDLRRVFEELLGGTWPLNIAQVYTALSALERDGLIECDVVPADTGPDRKVYSLSEVGEKELRRWLEEPGRPIVQLRDETVHKVLVAALVGDDGVLDLVVAQRDDAVRAMAELVSAREDPSLSVPTQLLLDAAILRLEGDVKWLELCEQRLVRRDRRRA